MYVLVLKLTFDNIYGINNNLYLQNSHTLDFRIPIVLSNFTVI